MLNIRHYVTRSEIVPATKSLMGRRLERCSPPKMRHCSQSPYVDAGSHTYELQRAANGRSRWLLDRS
jgi:hypothetical protein